MEIITFPKEPKNGNTNRNVNNKNSNSSNSNNKNSNKNKSNDKGSISRNSNNRGVNKTPPRKQNELKLDILEVDDFFDCKKMVENARKPSKSTNNPSVAPKRPRSASEREAQRKRRHKKVYLARMIFSVFIILLLVLIILLAKLIMDLLSGEKTIPQGLIVSAKEEIANIPKPDFEVNYLPVNEYSRPGDPLKEVKNVFIHYTGNIGTTGWQNRSYFENLAVTQETSASAHFVIGYEGEIIQCIPFDEIGYAVIGRNEDSISIECCYLDENGKFTDATYQSAIKLTAWLLDTYDLTVSDVLRHYDATGKECPKYYVDHPEEWEKWKDDLTTYIKSL